MCLDISYLANYKEDLQKNFKIRRKSMKEFNFKLEPGRKVYNNREYVESFPLISVIVPFYNNEK